MSEEQEKKKSDENLIKLALITAIISLAEKIIDLIIKLLDMWGVNPPQAISLSLLYMRNRYKAIKYVLVAIIIVDLILIALKLVK